MILSSFGISKVIKRATKILKICLLKILHPKMILMYKRGNPKVLINQNSSKLRDFVQAFGPKSTYFTI